MQAFFLISHHIFFGAGAQNIEESSKKPCLKEIFKALAIDSFLTLQIKGAAGVGHEALLVGLHALGELLEVLLSEAAEAGCAGAARSSQGWRSWPHGPKTQADSSLKRMIFPVGTFLVDELETLKNHVHRLLAEQLGGHGLPVRLRKDSVAWTGVSMAEQAKGL